MKGEVRWEDERALSFVCLFVCCLFVCLFVCFLFKNNNVAV
jgi:hypothetical protein